MTNNRYIGSSFDDFLAEEGILEDCTQFATDKVLEWQESNKNKVLQISNCEKKTVKRFGKLFQVRDSYFVYRGDKKERHLKVTKKVTSSC
jgi:hypothetical protein